MKSHEIKNLVISALLCAIGVAIPMFSPIKIPIPPMGSFTLASHVAIFLAMFISPQTAITVALVTALGFLFSFPLNVVLRALSHIVFAIIGSLILQKSPDILLSVKKSAAFSVLIALIHAACEVVVSVLFFFGGSLSEDIYSSGFMVFFISVLMSVGVVTLIHSTVDFFLALGIWKILPKERFGKV